MKFSATFTALVAVTLFSGQALAAAAQVNKGKGQGANNNKGAGANKNGTGNANNAGDAQSSLTIDPKVLATGFESNGQENATAGQVASLTSSNNFINFCLTVNKPITNGQQIKTGSCNPAPMGVIAATTNMPSSKFQSPVNGQDLTPNTSFDIKMAINNLETGNFVNAQANYYAAPQQVNGQGVIIGHTHVTVQAIDSFTSTAPLDPNTFAHFKGINTAAVNGVVSETVTGGLPAGHYRCCSINTDANHSPVLVAVAQHGSLDDCIYFSVGQGNGGNAFNGNGGNSSANAANDATPPANAANNATTPANNGANAKNAGNTGANAKNAGNTGAKPKNAGNPPAANPKNVGNTGANPKNAGNTGANAKNAANTGANRNQQQLGNKGGRRMVARLARDH